MDDFVKRRTPVRAAFTKRYNLLIATLNQSEINTEDIEIKLSSLERIASDLVELDEKISTALINAKSEDFDSEYEKCEEYREKLDEARICTKCCLNKIANMCEVSASIIGEKTKLKLPKIELMKFNGEGKHWLTFWSQYSRIHDDSSIGDEDKFQYLLQCVVIGSRAREIVDSYPPTADNYHKVIDSLKTRFGREELLVEYYVRELLSLVVKNVTSSKIKMNIMQFYDKLESHLRSLESIGVTSDKYAAMLFPLVESCIPEELLLVWLRNPVITKEEKDSYGDKLSHLLLFLRAEVEGEERISLAKAGFKSNEILTQKQNGKDQETLMPTANDLLSGVKVGKSPCIFCGKAHSSQDCFKGQKMSYEEKMDILRKNKACFTCMKTGHRSSNCKTNVRCVVCGKRHYTIVCPELSKSGKNTQTSSVEEKVNTSLFIQSKPEVLLQTLMVSIEAENSESPV